LPTFGVQLRKEYTFFMVFFVYKKNLIALVEVLPLQLGIMPMAPLPSLFGSYKACPTDS